MLICKHISSLLRLWNQSTSQNTVALLPLSVLQAPEGVLQDAMDLGILSIILVRGSMSNTKTDNGRTESPTSLHDCHDCYDYP
jgi:16S rRNA U1498 N3-methylase RsmE